MAQKKQSPLHPKWELFCRFYTQNDEMFGNATHAYAEAYGYKLDTLSQEPVYDFPEDIENRTVIKASPYDLAYNVCSVEGRRLLRTPKIQARCQTLLNELLKDEVVDSEMAKLIKQDRDLPTKIRSIAEYNKLRGRIIDKTKIITERFATDDIRALLAPLPKERQDQVYEIITSAIAEAELLRGGAEV